MQVNQSGSPFQLRLEPVPYRANALTPDQQMRRSTTASAAEKVFADTQRQLSEGQRLDTMQKARAPLYRQVQSGLENVAAQMGTLQQLIAGLNANGQAGGQGAGSSSFTSPALNLGDGQGIKVLALGSPAAPPPPPPPPPGPVENAIDPTKKLNTQPFETAITNGNLKVAFRVNGGASTTATITINKATQSLNDVLTALNNVTIGGVKPLTATFDAASQKVNLQVNSTSGTRFDFTLSGTSNFRTVIGSDKVSTQTTVTANAAIENSATKKIYNKLTINVEGVGSKAFNLTVSNAGLTADQKVNELVGQLNAGLGTLGLTAVNAGGGKIGLSQIQANAPAAPALGITITQATTASKLKLGFQSGFTTQATVKLDPNATEYTPPPSPPPPPPPPSGPLPPAATTSGSGLYGADATLGELAGQLGLNASNGRYDLTVNGQQLSFTQDQTLDDVLAGISNAGAGVYATYDAGSRTIGVLDVRGGGIAIADGAGNLASALGIDAPAASRNDAALGQSLRDLADALDGAIGTIEAGTAPGTGLGNDRLLSDLQASLSGLFASSANGPLAGLGDLGFSRTDGQLAFDASKIQDLLGDRRGEVTSFLGSFIGEKVAPLLRAGARALAAADEVGAAEAEAAARSVRVRGEISRLQVRQQMLALEKQSFDGLQDRLEKQREKLEENAAELARRTATGLPRDVEQTGRNAELLGRDRSGFVAPPTTISPATTTTASPAFGSFGMSSASTA